MEKQKDEPPSPLDRLRIDLALTAALFEAAVEAGNIEAEQVSVRATVHALGRFVDAAIPELMQPNGPLPRLALALLALDQGHHDDLLTPRKVNGGLARRAEDENFRIYVVAAVMVYKNTGVKVDEAAKAVGRLLEARGHQNDSQTPRWRQIHSWRYDPNLDTGRVSRIIAAVKGTHPKPDDAARALVAYLTTAFPQKFKTAPHAVFDKDA